MHHCHSDFAFTLENKFKQISSYAFYTLYRTLLMLANNRVQPAHILLKSRTAYDIGGTRSERSHYSTNEAVDKCVVCVVTTKCQSF